MKTIILITLLATSIVYGEKNVLVEIFTNSHCSVCPSAYSALDSYLATDNGSKIDFIFYHMSFPYSDDPLHLHNSEDAKSKNSYYGPHSSTPKAYFNGNLVTNSYSNWKNSLDNLISEESKIEISLSGSKDGEKFDVMADIIQTNDISEPNFTINYVVIEDINYSGRNGISDHKNVMRKVIDVQGESFSINLNETKNLSKSILFNPDWNVEKLKVIVFIQNSVSKEVYQSSSIALSDFSPTNIEDKISISHSFDLMQNYPNPFNPSTVINYTIPNLFNETGSDKSIVQLKVYDILGKEVSTLVNSYQAAGKHRIVFNASNLSSGFYYYQLKVGSFTKTKKMILLR